MDWKLELIVVPAADVDRAKEFYVQAVGFDLLVDHRAGEDFRVVQLSPRGSACAIALMRQPERAGSLAGLHLVVADIEAARSELLERGVNAGEHFHIGERGQAPGLHPGRRDYNSFFAFEDPDGNGWLVQEVGHGGARGRSRAAAARTYAAATAGSLAIAAGVSLSRSIGVTRSWPMPSAA